MNQLIPILLALLPLLPLVHPYTVSVYVNDHQTSNKEWVQVSSSARVRCYSFYDSGWTDPNDLTLKLWHTNGFSDKLLSSAPFLSNGWDISVLLTGITDQTELKCELTNPSKSVNEYQFVILEPSLHTPTSTTSAPKSGISFGSTYIVYILVIVVFLSFLASTGAVACWLSARLRANRARLQRAHAARLRQFQESLSSQADTVVLTHMQVSSRQGAPPPYEGAPINTTISLHIDSAPPCYQEALSQSAPAEEPAQPVADAPPPFEPAARQEEPLSTSTHSLEVLGEETDRLLSPSDDH